jgi:hypothetical protein
MGFLNAKIYGKKAVFSSRIEVPSKFEVQNPQIRLHLT